MKPVFASHLDRRALEAELLAEVESMPDAASQATQELEPTRTAWPSLRYRPFERFAARLRSN
jgi:hypothetical protein